MAMGSSTVRVQVRCFGPVREALGTGQLDLAVPAGTTADGLRLLLAERAPALQRLPVAFAVNRAYARADQALCEGDEVALIPPISGGGGRELYRFDLHEGPLDPRALEAEVRTDRDGAVVTFAGVTRDHNEGQSVTRLCYEAYPEMAQRVMMEIFEQAVKSFPLTRMRVAHRLGEVPVGEASVLVVVSAPHREAAFDACRFVMDRLKGQVPIFKHEELKGGKGGRWVGELPRAGASPQSSVEPEPPVR